MWVPNLADVDWMTDVLSRHAAPLGISGEVVAVHLLDARLTHPHRPGSSLCSGWATYHVTTRGTSAVQLYVKGFSGTGDLAGDLAGDPAGDLAGDLVRERGRAGPARWRAVHLPGPDLVVWRFPADPRLAALRTLVDPRRASRIVPASVRDVLGLRPGERLRTTVVRYQPETSATLRVEADRDGAPTVFAKHLPHGEVAEVAEVAARHHALWRTADRTRGLRLAEPLAADLDRGVSWTRGVAGGPLVSELTPARLPEVAAPIGALLAALHASSVAVARRVTVDDLLTETGKKTDKLARAHPAVARRVHDLVTIARARRADVLRERDRTLHGDFHLDQLVGSAEEPVLVDLDSMVRGAPEIDLAEFLVDLSLRRLPATVVPDVSRRLLASYTASAGVELDVALLAVAGVAEFVNRCYRHLRRHAPGWQGTLETELGRYADVASLLRP